MSNFMTEDPSEEESTNKPSPAGRIQERSKEDASPYASPYPLGMPVHTHLPESSSLKAILAEDHQEGSWVRIIGQRQPGN